jgi:hypothetical protein
VGGWIERVERSFVGAQECTRGCQRESGGVDRWRVRRPTSRSSASTSRRHGAPGDYQRRPIGQRRRYHCQDDDRNPAQSNRRLRPGRWPRRSPCPRRAKRPAPPTSCPFPSESSEGDIKKSVDLRLAPVEQHPGTTGLAAGPPEHADEYRPERPVLLAVDQEFGEGARRRFPW